jgi:myo-inositol 2-dehydrogenase / D-chiro-inositol 1-dehydrogenase
LAYLNRNPSDAAVPVSRPVRIGLIGSGWMGAFHAESIARRVPGAELAAIADPNVESAAALASALGTGKVTAAAADILADPEIDAVIIASPARFHSSLVAQAADAGKHVFCEKPAGLALDELDAALAAVERAGVHFQIGFNRRYAADFRAAKKDLAAGTVGTPQLLRSLTRDPGTGSIPNAARVPAWTVFLETLIHDFDTLNWFNEGAEPVEVFAVADALVEPGLRDQGFLDTAVVTIRYSNSAIAVAEANFSALYGYDIRGEVFGSKGMVQAGRATETAARRYTADGMSADTPRLNVELFRQAYTDELADFADAVRARRDGRGGPGGANGRSGEAAQPAAYSLTPGAADARRALAVALACIESVKSGTPVRVNNAGANTVAARETAVL